MNQGIFIFDSLGTQTNLFYERLQTYHDNDQFYQCIKIDENQKKKKIFQVVLKENYLYIVQNNVSNKRIDLNYCYLDIYEQGKEIILKLQKNNKIFTFMPYDPFQINIIQQMLLEQCICRESEFCFKMRRSLGTKFFAHEFTGKNKHTKKKYLVQQYRKEEILTQFQGICQIKNQIKILRRLNHPFIIQLTQVFETKDSIFFIINKQRGGQLIKQLNIFDQELFTIIAKNMLNALVYLDDQKIIHRNINLNSLYIETKEQQNAIILGDFQQAKFIDDQEIIKFNGQPGFIAPELLNNKEQYCHKCDVFSLGIVFYSLITGYQPFQGNTEQEILEKNKICNINFKRIKQESEELEDLLKKLLIPNPEQRITASEALNHKYFDSNEHQCLKISLDYSDKLSSSNSQMSQETFSPIIRAKRSSVIVNMQNSPQLSAKKSKFSLFCNTMSAMQEFQKLTNIKKTN